MQHKKFVAKDAMLQSYFSEQSEKLSSSRNLLNAKQAELDVANSTNVELSKKLEELEKQCTEFKTQLCAAKDARRELEFQLQAKEAMLQAYFPREAGHSEDVTHSALAQEIKTAECGEVLLIKENPSLVSKPATTVLNEAPG